MTNSTGFVTLGCKLPHGLILEMREKGSGEPRRITVLGANAARIVGGFGITEGVPEDFWKAWLGKNGKHLAVTSGALFSYDETKGAETEAKGRSDVKTGFEPIDPIKAGMLKGIDESDNEALKTYRQQVATNPDRHRQRVE